MGANGISNELLSFITDNIHSVEQVEILALLKQSGRGWTAERVRLELRSDLSSVTHWLDYCTSRGFLSKSTEGYSYAPSALYAPKLEELLEAYRIRKNRLIDLIYSKPRNEARILAEAFKWRKGRDDNS